MNQILEILELNARSIHKEKDWTTRELFDYFEIDPFSEIGASTQLEATHMIFKKMTIL